MALKLKLLIAAGLCVFATQGISAVILDAPESVTLSVDAAESGTLSWEPIDRDDLMGYSVWMRADKGEFTRLIIPTMVGKELKKLPMTTKSSITLKGLGKRDLELEVIAEYESGRSPASASVYSRLARRAKSERLAPDAAGNTAPLKAAPTDEPEKSLEEGQAPPPEHRVVRGVMAPPGKIQTSVGFGFLLEETGAKGFNSLNDIGIRVFDGTDPDTPQNWSINYAKRQIRVPFSMRYGLRFGLDLAVESAWSQNSAYQEDFNFGDRTYHNISQSAQIDGAGLDDTWVRARFRPAAGLPFFLSGALSFATGKSRFIATINNFLGRSKDAGTDEAVSRLRVSADFGERDFAPGLSYRILFSPSATELYPITFSPGNTVNFQAEHGQRVEASAAYTFPWVLGDMPGSCDISIGMNSIEAGRFLVDGRDQMGLLNKRSEARFRDYSGISFEREDQMEFGLSFIQNVYTRGNARGAVNSSLDLGGKASYALKPDGWIFAISGGFYY